MTARLTAAQYRAMPKPKPKRHKYGAKRTQVDGIKFHSKGEALRWMELKRLHRAGKIAELCRQLAFPLHVNGICIGKYVVDFGYWDIEQGAAVYEDFKGMRNPLSDWKIRHYEAEYKRKILLTGRAAGRKRRKA